MHLVALALACFSFWTIATELKAGDSTESTVRVPEIASLTDSETPLLVFSAPTVHYVARSLRVDGNSGDR
ncbi:hypothetical protein [Synechococcus sp. PCC 7336]|uniref:hypothetical protein n=1 Tax=Synechococcus sp. PCC 7336 TaxID=195250 RepID=UPI000347AE66|nr:hypothetical protein [Synechococcus sp. PCC 7336]